MNDEQRTALVGLAGLASMSPVRLALIVESHEPLEALRRLVAGRPLAEPAQVKSKRGLWDVLSAQARSVDPARLVAECEQSGMAVLVADDGDYPSALRFEKRPPAVLFALGSLATLDARRVGIIGTRNATAAGRATAHQLGAELSELDVAVVSGLARGIDGAAHRGVRSAAGRAVGVVANGLDVPYPKQNRDIWEWVAVNGLLLSEWPPGAVPDAWRFPHRNRIIAALSEVLVVVESRERGGSLITAEEALDRGRTVMAVPGSLHNRSANGTNKLLNEGAQILTCVADVLVALGLDHSRSTVQQLPGLGEYDAPLDSPEAELDRLVAARCAEFPCTVDMVVAGLGIDVTDAVLALRRLTVAGLVIDTNGWFESSGSRLAGLPGGSGRGSERGRS